MKNLTIEEIEDLIKELNSKNALIAVCINERGTECVIYYCENSKAIKLNSSITWSHYADVELLGRNIFNLITNNSKRGYYGFRFILILDNIDRDMLSKKYLSIKVITYEDANTICIVFNFPGCFSDNSKSECCMAPASIASSNIGNLLSINDIKKLVKKINKLTNVYSRLLNNKFKFVDKYIEALSDEEKLYLEL